MRTPRANVVVLASALALGSLASACYVEEGAYAEGPPVYAYGYEPAYYDGYVVYYDDVGRPFYYRGGAVIWISPGAPAYPGLVARWRAYGPAYHHWYIHHGYRYRGYHRGHR